MHETGLRLCKPPLMKAVATGADQQREPSDQLMLGYRLVRIAVKCRTDGGKVKVGQIIRPLWYGISTRESCVGEDQRYQASA